MRERPILFSAPMVRAILEGRKSMTRRVVKFPGNSMNNDGYEYVAHEGIRRAPWNAALLQRLVPCPYGVPGDKLWVRETWQGLNFGSWDEQRPARKDCCEIRYAATERLAGLDSDTRGYVWRPCIFMPRWASRITLEITNVRVERVQDITEEDAIAEGCERTFEADGSAYGAGLITAADNFKILWDSINGKTHPWAVNDWVWVVEFKRVQP